MELEVASFGLPQAIDNALTLVRGRAGARGIALAVVDGQPARRVPRGTSARSSRSCSTCSPTPSSSRPRAAGWRCGRSPWMGMWRSWSVDTGIGIAPHDQETVFEEFRQVGTDYAMKREGTGLGLTLSRKFVELHGGRIWVKSALGEGSTFTFTLPVRPWPGRSSYISAGPESKDSSATRQSMAVVQGGISSDRAAVAQRRVGPGRWRSV